jgi:hypothetical protein
LHPPAVASSANSHLGVSVHGTERFESQHSARGNYYNHLEGKQKGQLSNESYCRIDYVFLASHFPCRMTFFHSPLSPYCLFVQPRDILLTLEQALFAMPFFNWDGGDLPIVKDGFKYYWAIAIPLTLLVLLIWAASMLLPWRRWLSEIKCRYEKDDVEAADGAGKKDD